MKNMTTTLGPAALISPIFVLPLATPQTLNHDISRQNAPWLPTPQENRAYREGHERLVARAANGALVVAERSGHNIPGERPDLAVSVLEGLVGKIRQRSP
jgi:hypothetical protein